jgi:hypothetical protein
MADAAERVWSARLTRRHHAQILLDPAVRELDRELKRAIADAGTLEERIERLREGQDRIGEHLGLGPRPR